ncbi:siderophore-iron reductase FhuF [Billgrantia aerodenitrificans]|jgi:ferric iron reductase protein FhuF|uniref:Siderophore-iron reductase FhuF n=1 Tax=Billgrantia aerodenitrificans TaxID=2733483 RepID=A0ABS9ASQ9_9GAMM|nr:siderophore-iron reductase FhuF [Halomonas aerodenitrificans]MCE8024890.1 siderophore-iron reductase FhuF [Halomonas aerodenitrificans]
MIELLTPVFQGEWAHHGEALICSKTAGSHAYRLADLLDQPREIDDILIRRARFVGCDDLRPVAVVWLLKYVTLLVPPVAVAASVLEHGFPVGPKDISVILDDDAEPVAFVIPHLGESIAGLDTQRRYAPLLQEHLEPLIDYLSTRTRVPTKLLWGNVSRRLESILILSQQLTEYPPETAQRAASDKEYLLERKTWPGGQRNPMFSHKRHATRITEAGEVPVRLHRHCCLVYRLPGKGYCGLCPLSPEFRKRKGATYTS